MDGLMRVKDLIEELEELPADAFVMVAVVKYPGEWTPEGATMEEVMARVFRDDGDGPAWDLNTNVEVHPLEHGEVTLQRGMVYLTAELDDYSVERALGTTTP